MTRKSCTLSRCCLISAWHCGSRSASQLSARSKVLKPLKLCRLASATMPMLIDPEASRISQTQYPGPIRWLVDSSRRPSTRCCQSASSVQLLTSIG